MSNDLKTPGMGALLGAEEKVVRAELKNRHILFLSCGVLLTVFLLSLMWEFAGEGLVLTFLGIGNADEPAREHWRYVALISCFTAVALIVPTWVLMRINTGHNRAETALLKSEKWFSAVMDASPAGIYLKDIDGRFLFANRRYETWCGIEGGVKGRTVHDFFPKGQADFRASQDREVIKSGRAREYETNMDVPGNGSITVNVITFPVFGHDHAVVGVGAVNTDITARKKAEDVFIGMMDNAVRANQAKSNFLAHMSHELRTPLNAILGFAQMMEEQVFGPLGESHYEEYAKDINASGRHLLSLINDVLDLSKIEAGKLDIHPEHLDLHEIIATSLEVVRGEASVEQKVIYTEVAETLPHLLADGRMVKQMLLNLLSNAIKFTPENGRITVGAAVAVDGGLTLTVSDSGIGIAEDQMARVLTPFGQIDNDLNRRHKGAGLGIPLVMGLAKLHNGSLELKSVIGVGTRATLYFPPERVLRCA
ncbi:MAG: hypothetical protein A3G18_05195 [Rhodospirillales bacterium RIFCSPLOWO2_12_FULL_58_28]|nr:MAG: hypothetical protein A3H92_05290 [Rhodospirillales bacterium RIFCSPLOWO2_02_FULL_58_16]OHC78304.1 MAG: hypothetical protein A3G18_05195 [Rhodospirillales bacterium RIFCSPLOWO2_12_FULL_58_28]